jgi:hypothetical protein
MDDDDVYLPIGPGPRPIANPVIGTINELSLAVQDLLIDNTLHNAILAQLLKGASREALSAVRVAVLSIANDKAIPLAYRDRAATWLERVARQPSSSEDA